MTIEQFEIALFWMAVVTAGASSVIYIRNFFLRKESSAFMRAALVLSIFSVLFLTIVLGLRWGETGLHPFTGPFSTKTFFAFAVMFAYLLIELAYAKRAPKVRYVGVLVLPIAVLLMLVAWTQWDASAAALPPALRSFRVGFHVTTALLAYGSFTVATVFALIYLVQESQLKRKKAFSSSSSKLPSLETAESVTYRAIGLGFVFSIMLILAGMLTAQQEWGRLWSWQEPREVSALGMLIVYGAYLGLHDLAGWRGRRINYIALVGFAAAIFTYFAPQLFESMHQWG